MDAQQTKKEQERAHNPKKIGINCIVVGVIIFILRFIPFYPYKQGFIDTTISLDQAASFCNSFLGTLVGNCSWVKLLNILSYIVPVALVGYGTYLIITEKNRNKIK